MTQSGQHKQAESVELSFLSERYSDIALLGAGGMGKLYRGFDKVLNKRVAIKVLSSKRPDSKMVVRFQQEAKLASRLQHTNIVKILDFGAGSEQELYLIMDLVQGKTLQEFIEQNGPLKIEEAAPLLMQMCDALTHAHNHGVIHRDIKPSNIMLAEDKQNAHSVRIVDFGLARLESRDVRITQTGDTIGTPLYISPEQIKGEEIDFRADIYSLGCVIFTVLSGRPPYRGKKALDTFQMHLHDPIPSLADAGVEDPRVEELDTILERLLAKSPNDRYQNLIELKEDLSVFLPDEVLAVKKMDDDTSLNVKVPFIYKSRVSKRMMMVVLLLVIGVPLLIMSLEMQKPDAKVPQSNEMPLDQSALWAPGKETVQAKLFYDKKGNGNWHHKDCRVVDEDLNYLAKKKVVELDLEQTRVKGWGLRYLKNQPLTTLNMPEAKVTDKDIHHLNDLKNLRNLKMGFTWISTEGLKTIEPHPTLEVLSVEGCSKFNDESIAELIRIGPNLHTINLSFLSITGKGLEYLKNSHLKCVTLSNNSELTDKDLLPVLMMKTVTLIDISKCPKITDKSIRALEQSKSLEKLVVSECPLVSPAALDRLQRRLPKLNIEREHHVNEKEAKKMKTLSKFLESTGDNKLPDIEIDF